ncbi:IclR family transcriptional regulator [Paracoccus sp. (in: a-proteobacteria)]|uniref:IclR family transcriptional regulator n=1 Tax=Paracoccus sp. TaxID=267 RepID=UPI0039E35377
MQSKELAQGKLVGALATGLKVLRYLSESQRPVGVSQIARDLKLNGSTCFNILKTLVQEDLIVFLPDDKTYQVGPGLLVLVKGVIEGDVVRRAIRPHLEALAATHHVTATLFERIGENRMILVDRAENAKDIRVQMNLGQRMPMLAGAFGRCMAAFLDLTVEEIEARFNEVRWQDPPSFKDYMADVRKAKNTGYAVDRDNFGIGVVIIAAPIFMDNVTPSMVISVVGFSAQIDGPTELAIARDLRTRAQQVSEISQRPMVSVGRR